MSLSPTIERLDLNEGEICELRTLTTFIQPEVFRFVV